MSPIFAGIAAFFSVAAFVFYVIAASGYSKDYRVLKGCQWIYYQNDIKGAYYNYDDDYYGKGYYHYDIVENFYFGLKGYYVHYNFNEVGVSVDKEISLDKFYDYNNNSYFFSILKECDKSGKITFDLTIVALVLSFVSIITNSIGFVNETTVIKAGGAVLSIIACIFGIIAVSMFMTSCYSKVHDGPYDNSTKNLHYGTGSILAITAVLCNFVAFILAIINIVTTYYRCIYAPPPENESAPPTGNENAPPTEKL